MQVDLLKNIVSYFAGSGSVGIVDLLYNKKNVNEFLIAKKLNMTINQTRNILYKLADEGLVSFVRKKDSKKGGWYTYFWTLNARRSLSRFKDKLTEDLNRLKNRLNERKTKRFYYSEGADIEYSEEQALLNDYTCPETGEVLTIRSSEAEVKELEKEAAKFEELLVHVDRELEVIKDKEDKALSRKLKKEQKEKEEKRRKARKKAAKKRSAKKAKKKTKKKVKKKAAKKKVKKKAKKKVKSKVKKKAKKKTKAKKKKRL